MAEKVPPGVDTGPRPAADNPITLDQALLAPLDAIFTAQLHAARSFLNMLLQLGYPHEDETQGKVGDGKPYQLVFTHTASVDGVERQQKIAVPALSLVPVAPLAVQTAQFQLEMAIKRITDRKQMRDSAHAAHPNKRPWYLVDNPINIEGVFAPPRSEATDDGKVEREGSIRIDVKIGAIPMPAGLDKLLTALTQTSRVYDEPPPTSEPNIAPTGDPSPSGPATGTPPPAPTEPSTPPTPNP